MQVLWPSLRTNGYLHRIDHEYSCYNFASGRNSEFLPVRLRVAARPRLRKQRGQELPAALPAAWTTNTRILRFSTP